MKILIFEPDGSGHHLEYLSYIVDSLRERMLYICTSRKNLKKIREHYPDCLLGKQNVSFVPDSKNILIRLCFLIKNLWEIRPCILFFPYGDAAVYFLPLVRFFYPFSNLTIQMIFLRGRFCPTVYPGFLSGLKKALIKVYTKLNLVQKLFIIDDLIYNALKREGLSGSAFVFLPDPMPDWNPISKEDARRKLNLPTEDKIILSFGSLSLRKGIGPLIEIIRQGMLPDNVKLLLAGQPDEYIGLLLDAANAEISGFRDKVILRTDFISKEDVPYYFFSADIVLANYHNHIGPSGVLLKAVAAKRPVIGPDFGWVGWALRRINPDWIYDTKTKEAFEKKLLSLLALPSVDFNKGFDDERSVQKFKAIVRNSCR